MFGKIFVKIKQENYSERRRGRRNCLEENRERARHHAFRGGAELGSSMAIVTFGSFNSP